MCGRFAFGTRLEQALVGLNVQTDLDPEPRWNIAPTDQHPMLIHDEGDVEVVLGRWGFTSSAEAVKAPINARIETTGDKPVFREAMQTARMAAPATGWYEWMSSPVGRHPHHHTLVEGDVMWLAGILHPVGLEGFALLTQEATAAIAHVHSRMPVVLSSQEVEAWLEHGTLPEVQSLVTSWAVSMDVNHTGREGAHLCEPIPTLF
jgi:putative SOS response-associated peptidase YedK